MDNVTRLLMQGAAGAAGDPTYVDDVFSTYLYKGNGAARSIVNGIDLAGEGGMVWTKNRTSSLFSHRLFDTERGIRKMLSSNTDAAESSNSQTLTAYNSNGFSLGTDSMVNSTNDDTASWSFRKSEGFFDVVTYTGSSSARTISHNLGCVPGAIFIKKTSGSDYWAVYHRDADSTSPEDYYLKLNTTDARIDDANFWNDTKPTANVFSLGDAGAVNSDGHTYVAYLFAGGASTAATARSVSVGNVSNPSQDDYINTTASSSDFTMGTGDFTIECWVKRDDAQQGGIFQISPTSGGLQTSNYGNTLALASVANVAPGRWQIYGAGGYTEATPGHYIDQWVHMAYVRNSGVSKLYMNGTQIISQNDTTNYDGTYIAIGCYYDTSMNYKGHISNFRVVKGTAVYTSAFRPPTKPLTNISGTVLLCCNNSSVTGSTVTPVTLNSQGSPTASTDSPFDDPEGYKFGGEGDQNIIKCGSYKGNSSTDFAIFCGWEPQYIMFKSRSSGHNWSMFDSIRGIVTEGNENYLYPNLTNSEYAAERISATPTGFIVDASAGALINENNEDMIYVAIRMPDGYVGKPAEAGTESFAMDAGNGNTTQAFDSGFPVDFAITRAPASATNWETGGRLIQRKWLATNTDSTESPATYFSFDSNTGWMEGASAYNSTYQSWMWKRGTGFDVVTYTGNGVNGRDIFHSMNNVPQMIIVKRRSSTEDWTVYQPGLTSINYIITLNSNNAESSLGSTPEKVWKSAPTSKSFEIGSHDRVNTNGQQYLAVLFSNVEGISKSGYFDGSNSELTITTGFSPRFLIVKAISTSGHWNTLDTVRGWGAGNDPYLKLNADSTQNSGYNIGAPTATGFTLTGNMGGTNVSGVKYLYYAHA